MKSRYQIIGEINQGGVGVVLKAWDTKLSRHVAIKRCHSAEQRAAMGNVEGDLLREASTLSSMQHPNIVSIHDVDMEAEAGPEVIMEYLNGQDLEHAVSQAALTLEDFYQVAQQTLDALSNAHRMNLLHRDIKPANIQVTWLANGKFVSKFVDFGLAKFFETPSRQTVRSDGTVMGSIYYMAPEQLERLPLDNRSDLYSLGCVFYYGLTMHRPFEGTTVMDVIHAHLHSRPVRIRDYRPNVPRNLELWVEWMISRRPENRPPDADTALNTLRQIMAGQTPDCVPGANTASQPVKDAPMRTGTAPAPVGTAFVRTGVVEATHRAPAARAKKAARRKTGKPQGGQIAMSAGIAAALVAGLFLAFSRGGKKNPVNGPEAAISPAELLEATTRRTELDQAKSELAAAQARLAMKESSMATTALQSTKPADLSRPPGDGLVLWFDASRGTFADAQQSPTPSNGPVGQWQDQSDNSGVALFQYTQSSSRDREQNYPTLRTAPAGAGLLKATPVVSFDGSGDTLCVRDRDKAGEPLAASLDGGKLSVLMLFRDNGQDAPAGLLSMRGAEKKDILTLGTKDGGLVAGPGNEAPVKIAGTELEFRIASCVLDAGAGSLRLGLISGDSQKLSTEIKAKVDPALHLESIRMGTSDDMSAKDRSLLAADVAEILIYNRALDRETRHSAENYLRKKYFGSTGPTVTANTPR